MIIYKKIISKLFSTNTEKGRTRAFFELMQETNNKEEAEKIARIFERLNKDQRQ